MTLLELSAVYAEGAERIHHRMLELRLALSEAADPVEAEALRRRLRELLPMWRDMREMTRRTAHYYDRRCVIHGKRL